MTSAVRPSTAYDYTDVPHVLRSGAQLGVVQSLLVALFAIVSNKLSGPLELGLEAILLLIGLAVTLVLPGLWTRARSIEGIAGAAGIGLFATAVFLVIDVALFQPLHLYSNRWLEIGGGANWWYHSVWWMVGTFVPWMGAWALANQADRGGSNPIVVIGGVVVLAIVLMVVTALTHFPGAAFGVGTFGVATLPAAALMVVVTSLGARRP